jgi:hypothetical protein
MPILDTFKSMALSNALQQTPAREWTANLTR